MVEAARPSSASPAQARGPGGLTPPGPLVVLSSGLRSGRARIRIVEVARSARERIARTVRTVAAGVDQRQLVERRGTDAYRSGRGVGRELTGTERVHPLLQERLPVRAVLADVVVTAVGRVAVRVQVEGAVPVQQAVTVVRAVVGHVALQHVAVPAAVLPVDVLVVLVVRDVDVVQ